MREWSATKRAGGTITDFFRSAQPLQPRGRRNRKPCLVCPDAPAWSTTELCYLHSGHYVTWRRFQEKKGKPGDLDLWLPDRDPYPDLGQCRVPSCPDHGVHWIGLCYGHLQRYKKEGRPGDARLIKNWGRRPAGGKRNAAVELTYADEAAFDQWCAKNHTFHRADGKLSLLGLRPLVRAEIKWGLFRHAQGPEEGARWPVNVLQRLLAECLRQDVSSLADIDLEQLPDHLRKIARAMLGHLRVVYFTRQDTKAIGYIETDLYGVRLKSCGSYLDLSKITQRWLRDLLWDWMDLRLNTDPPRSPGSFNTSRRGCTELSAYLEAQAPAGGHDPRLLTKQHMEDFVADQRHRAAHGLKSLAIHDTRSGEPNAVSKLSMSRIFTGTRRILRAGMDSGDAQRIGLDHAFIVALPYGGSTRGGRRKPFSDDTAKAIASEGNLQLLDDMDSEDRGLRDIWEALVVTGRRCSEVIEVRLECVDRLNKLPMFWHDQTKVGNFDEGIRISERLYQRIVARQKTTISRFVQQHGREPSAKERLKLALFPRKSTNRSGTKSMSYGWFQTLFGTWISNLDLPHSVAHQARHTLATNLLKNGANLTHVKRYLGQVSDSMAEHYVHLANTDPKLEEALQAVWVAGPGAVEPGLALSSGEPMTRAQAEALAIDLTRKSTPAEGGFCTFQLVVDGGACPWNLDCHNCDKFVMSGADLVYWHRKREHWCVVAEGAPEPATRDYLHDLFEPTARAIAGLEKALDAVGLLEEALALDLRRPQDYFGRVWATAFRASELARHEADMEDEYDISAADGEAREIA
ncbi:tyrosine-type recombinase/integrase [Streptomyces sp. NPDC048825]|uniref:tyrosine-type recombinase/integrase n=1 Tax=Streptomyces sp. NPDC048825 TaxID=3365592 RepID=UPI0037210C82